MYNIKLMSKWYKIYWLSVKLPWCGKWTQMASA